MPAPSATRTAGGHGTVSLGSGIVRTRTKCTAKISVLAGTARTSHPWLVLARVAIPGNSSLELLMVH